MEFNFIHIPKCGGTSIRKMYNLNYEICPDHWFAKYKPDVFNFAIVRNPYTRIQSIFAHLKECYNNLTNIGLFSTLDQLSRIFYNSNHQHHSKAVSMLKWTRQRLDSTLPQDPKALKLACITCDGSAVHFAPQSIFITNDNIKLIRLEHLEHDLIKVQKEKLLPDTIQSLEKKMSSRAKFKQMAKLTPMVLKLVQDVYAHDLELFEKVNGFQAQPPPPSS